MGDWIPVEQQMPPEKDSIFAKFYGTPRWRESMFRKASEDVLVTVEYEDGYRMTDHLRTMDGEWNDNAIAKRRKVAWMPMPEPYRG